jgi:hypothetical protein
MVKYDMEFHRTIVAGNESLTSVLDACPVAPPGLGSGAV